MRITVQLVQLSELYLSLSLTLPTSLSPFLSPSCVPSISTCARIHNVPVYDTIHDKFWVGRSQARTFGAMTTMQINVKQHTEILTLSHSLLIPYPCEKNEHISVASVVYWLACPLGMPAIWVRSPDRACLF